MVTICHSSIDERGKASGGIAGDQTGKEVCTRGWYSKNWKIVFRYKDREIAKKVAVIAKKIADSGLVGYDQGQRNTLYQALEKFNWNVDAYIKSGIKTECDCSSFVYACWCCLVAALRKSGNAPTTSTMASTLTEKNGFTAYKESKYLTTDSYLLAGDVIDSPGSHVVMAITNGDKTTENNNTNDIKNDTKSVVPKYTIGKSYTLMTELNVRTGAGTGSPKKSWSQLTVDGRKHDVDKDGALDKGTVITCQEVKNVGNDIWIRIPSGWIAAYYQGEIFVR